MKLPLSWCLMTSELRAWVKDTVECKLVVEKLGPLGVLKNSPFPQFITVSQITVDSWSEKRIAVLPPNQPVTFSLQLPASLLTTLPPISLTIVEFPRVPVVLSSTFASLQCPRTCVNYFSFSQFRVTREERGSELITPLEEECFVGCVNTMEYEVKKKEEEEVCVEVEEALRECCEVKRNENCVCVQIDLRDSKWLQETREAFDLVMELRRQEEVIQHRTVRLRVVQPLSITAFLQSNDLSFLSEHITVFADYSFGVDCRVTSLVSSLTIHSITLHSSLTPLSYQQTPLQDAANLPPEKVVSTHFDLSLPPDWRGRLRVEVEFSLWAFSPLLTRRRDLPRGRATGDLPVVSVRPPPVTATVRWPSPVVKGVAQEVTLSIANQSTTARRVSVQVQRGAGKWVVGGVLESEEVLLAREVLEKRLVVVPLQGGQMRFEGVTVRLPELECEVPLREEEMEVFVQDCLCCCVCWK